MKKALSELIATFFLVFAGTGAIVIDQESNGVITHLGVAITFGLVVIAMIYAFGQYSGAHMNPAVSIALFIGKKISGMELISYVCFQLIGASVASLLLLFLFPGNISLGSTHPSGSDIQSFILELILTFFLMFTILTTTKEKNNYAGIVIGLVVLLEALFAGPICGASMNPARSFGPAIISNNFNSLWIYILAPIFGAILALFSFKFFEK